MVSLSLRMFAPFHVVHACCKQIFVCLCVWLGKLTFLYTSLCENVWKYVLDQYIMIVAALIENFDLSRR